MKYKIAALIANTDYDKNWNIIKNAFSENKV